MNVMCGAQASHARLCFEVIVMQLHHITVHTLNKRHALEAGSSKFQQFGACKGTYMMAGSNVGHLEPALLPAESITLRSKVWSGRAKQVRLSKDPDNSAWTEVNTATRLTQQLRSRTAHDNSASVHQMFPHMLAFQL
eukprot:358988-Chlamydomonas_euryale.AAC.1